MNKWGIVTCRHNATLALILPTSSAVLTTGFLFLLVLMPRKRKSDVEEGASTGPTKRAKNDPDAEKRLAKWKPKCPQNILERVSRVMTQRFFMISRDRVDGELREEFTVSGSTYAIFILTSFA